MNIEATMPGTSFEAPYRIDAYGAESGEGVRTTMYRLYRKAARRARDSAFSREEFGRLMDEGHILCIVLKDPEEACVVAGIELMRDDEGPYLQLLFVYGEVMPHVHALVTALCIAWYEHTRHSSFHGEEGRCRIGGRRGWRKVLDKLGLEYETEENGVLWVREYQAAFGYPNTRKH